MGKPNVHKLPEHLRRKADGTFFLDLIADQEDGSKRRVVKVLGKIPRPLAMKIRDKILTEQTEGRFFFRPKVTFRQAAEGFLEYSRNRKRTYRADQQTVATLSQAFGDRPLDTLTPDAVERFIHALRPHGRKGRPLAPGTLNRYLACLKSIVLRALANNLLDRNPIQGVKLFKELNVRDRTLGPEEYRRLLEACPEHLAPIVTLAYQTGMRRGEILGLRWDQVRLADGVIALEGRSTKTGEAREIPLDQELVELLRRQPKVPDCPQVFTYRGKAIGDSKTGFNAACRKEGIEDFRFHDLRHCAVTNLRKAGVPQNVIMSISGHKTDAMFRRYDRVDRDDRQAALEQMKRRFSMEKGLREKAKETPNPGV